MRRVITGPRFEAGYAPLFHGTAISAQTILEQGLVPLDFESVRKRVLAEHAVDSTAFGKELAHRFVRHRKRDRYVHLTGIYNTAASYAVEGGEAERMLLSVIHRATHGPEESFDRRGSEEQWIASVFEQRVPIVVTIHPPHNHFLLRDRVSSYRALHGVPPEWIIKLEEVKVCVCGHRRREDEPTCRLLCPICRTGACPATPGADSDVPWL